jgi:hypothetical protein
MAKRKGSGRLVAGLIVMVAVAVLLAACNLGQNAPSEPLTNGETLEPQDVGAQEGQPTATSPINVPPTNTPVPELLPAEELGPISVEGDTHRTLEAVTIRVTVGTAVSNDTCSWVHQDTNQSGALGTPAVNEVDASTVQKVYTFTPEMAGTYLVNCTGIATTASGQRAVSAAGTPFTVEAKG